MLKSAIPFICKPIMQTLNVILNSGKFENHRKMELSLQYINREIRLMLITTYK